MLKHFYNTVFIERKILVDVTKDLVFLVSLVLIELDIFWETCSLTLQSLEILCKSGFIMGRR